MPIVARAEDSSSVPGHPTVLAVSVEQRNQARPRQDGPAWTGSALKYTRGQIENLSTTKRIKSLIKSTKKNLNSLNAKFAFTI